MNLCLRRLAPLAAGVLLLALGCQSNQPPAGESDTAIAAAVGRAIVFETEGEPLDVPAPAGATLTLGDAVERAMAHDPAIQSALARVRSAKAEAKQSRLLPNPVLSVLVRFPEGGGSPEIEASLAADLISLLRRSGTISVADNQLRAASAEALSSALDALAEVQSHYAAVQTLGQMVTVLEDRLTIVDRLLTLSRDRLEAGEGTRLDVLTLETQRVEVATEIADRKLELREQRLALSRIIGEPSGAAEWEVSAWEPARPPVVAESRWVSLANEKRPEVQAKRFELAARGDEVKLARLSPFDGAEVALEVERTDGNWLFGPGISTPIPLFDWGQAKKQQAQADLIEARHELTRVRRQVVEETRRAYAALSASQENLDRVRDELVPLQEKRRAQAEAQWKGGQTDVTTLLVAEQDLRSAQTRQLELERRVSEARVQLERAVGGPGTAAGLNDSSPTTAPVK